MKHTPEAGRSCEACECGAGTVYSNPIAEPSEGLTTVGEKIESITCGKPIDGD